ncbi:MAG: hypothetical protein AABX03_01260 [Nanoarchaeota archaeon]
MPDIVDIVLSDKEGELYKLTLEAPNQFERSKPDTPYKLLGQSFKRGLKSNMVVGNSYPLSDISTYLLGLSITQQDSNLAIRATNHDHS